MDRFRNSAATPSSADFILSDNENVPNLKLPNSSWTFQISLAATLASQRGTISVFWQPVSVKVYLPSGPVCPLTVHPDQTLCRHSGSAHVTLSWRRAHWHWTINNYAVNNSSSAACYNAEKLSGCYYPLCSAAAPRLPRLLSLLSPQSECSLPTYQTHRLFLFFFFFFLCMGCR